MRRAAKTDATQAAIVRALKAAGCTVLSTAALGHGAPDLIVGYRGRDRFLEVKNPPGPQGGVSENGQHRSEIQRMWALGWRGAPVVVVTTPLEALAAVGAVKAGGPAGHATARS